MNKNELTSKEAKVLFPQFNQQNVKLLVKKGSWLNKLQGSLTMNIPEKNPVLSQIVYCR